MAPSVRELLVHEGSRIAAENSVQGSDRDTPEGCTSSGGQVLRHVKKGWGVLTAPGPQLCKGAGPLGGGAASLGPN